MLLADERMSVEHQWNDSDRRKTEVLGEKPVSMPQWTVWGLNLDSSVRN